LPKSNFTATAQRLPISTRISPGLKPPTCDIEIQSFYCRNDAIFPHHDLPFLAAIDIATGNQHLRYQNHRFGVAVVHFGGSSGVVAAGYGQNLLEPLRRTHLNANYFAWVGSGLAVACALAVTLPN
jgi:hypothetical protein